MKWFLAFLLVFSTSVQATAKKVCLNMIVKDESQVITRCLNTVKPFIDYWVIVDTGSTDGTQDVIREFMKDVPGELYERPWKNFGHNRNEALQLAKDKGDYLLFIDADEVMEGSFDKKTLTHDVYLGTLRLQTEPLTTCLRALLLSTHKTWEWRGVIHESLKYEGERSFETLPNVVVSAEAKDGNRAKDPNKYLNDAKTLEKALLDEPGNTEYAYYLAQSYYLAKEFPLALKSFQRRAKMDGWDQQTFWSKYYTGHVQELLGMDFEEIVKSYTDAYQYRPTRAEPLARLANLFYDRKEYILGYLLSKFGKTIPVPNDIIYVEDWVYSYGMEAIFANCAMELGKHEEACAAYAKIAQKTNIPEIVRSQAKATIRYLEGVLHKGEPFAEGKAVAQAVD